MIKGEKIILRPMIRSDIALFEEWANDLEYTSEYNNFGLHGTAYLEKRFNEDGFLSTLSGRLVVTTLEGEVIGDVSYHPESYGPGETSRAYNIGISLHAKYRGRGYGVEAQKLFADYLFATYPVKRVEASTDVTNIPEQRALEKAGFTREGVLRQVQWRNGAFHDMVVYGKLRGE